MASLSPTRVTIKTLSQNFKRTGNVAQGDSPAYVPQCRCLGFTSRTEKIKSIVIRGRRDKQEANRGFLGP